MNSSSKKGGNTGSLKRSNMALVVQLVRAKGALSRTELSRLTGLSKGGLTPIIQELIVGKVLQETGVMNSDSGRKPIMLEVCPRAGAVIAVDFNRHDLQLGVIDFDNQLQSFYEYKYSGKESTEDILEKLVTLVKFFKEQNKDKHIVAVGVAAPGPLDYVQGEILTPPNFNNWSALPIKKTLEGEVGLQTFLDKDSNAYAMAEKVLGAGRQYQNFIHINFSEGIGSGVVLNERLFRGARGFGTELGHVTVAYDGLPCDCGNTGCLEQYASLAALTRWIEKRVKENGEKASPRMASAIERGSKLEWEQVVEGLKAQDPLCVEAINRAVEFLGCGLVDVVNLFAPQAIVIGGRVTLAGNTILEPLRQVLKERSFYKNDFQPDILMSTVKEGALMGIANIAFEYVLQESIEMLLK